MEDPNQLRELALRSILLKHHQHKEKETKDAQVDIPSQEEGAAIVGENEKPEKEWKKRKRDGGSKEDTVDKPNDKDKLHNHKKLKDDKIDKDNNHDRDSERRKDKHHTDKSKDKKRSRERSRDRSRDRNRIRERSRDRSRERRRNRSRDRSRNRRRSRERSRDRSRSRDKSRNRRSRDRSRDRSRERAKVRRDRRERSRDRSKERSKSRSRDRSRESRKEKESKKESSESEKKGKEESGKGKVEKIDKRVEKEKEKEKETEKEKEKKEKEKEKEKEREEFKHEKSGLKRSMKFVETLQMISDINSRLSVPTYSHPFVLKPDPFAIYDRVPPSSSDSVSDDYLAIELPNFASVEKESDKALVPLSSSASPLPSSPTLSSSKASPPPILSSFILASSSPPEPTVVATYTSPPVTYSATNPPPSSLPPKPPPPSPPRKPSRSITTNVIPNSYTAALTSLSTSEHTFESQEQPNIELDTNHPAVNSQIGMRLMQKMGWTGASGLGKNENGIVAPLAPKAQMNTKGLGAPLTKKEEKRIRKKQQADTKPCVVCGGAMILDVKWDSHCTGDWHQQNQKLFNVALGKGMPFVPLPEPLPTHPSETPPPPPPVKTVKKRPPPPPAPPSTSLSSYANLYPNHTNIPLTSFPTQNLNVGPGVSLFYNSYTNAVPNLQSLLGTYQPPNQMYSSYYTYPTNQTYPTQYYGLQ